MRDASELLGREVLVHLQHGSKFTGTVREVRRCGVVLVETPNGFRRYLTPSSVVDIRPLEETSTT